MIRGKNVYLRTVRESDLDFYYAQACDVEGATQFYPITVPSEVKCKRDFHEYGFWTDTINKVNL